MPEMLQYCGRQFRVAKRAHKTCDTIHYSGSRKMSNTVHLDDLRCDGTAHGGCQAGCTLFWKDAWLKRVPAPENSVLSTVAPSSDPAAPEDVIWRGTRQPNGSYRCQATDLLKATRPLKWWDFRQYAEDVASGNVTIGEIIHALLLWMFKKVIRLGAYNLLIGAYDRMQARRGGIPFPYKTGKLHAATPAETLDLESGEVVQVKTHDEILGTVNQRSRNRGLSFDPEMVKYCGGQYRVLRRVERIINEKTGEMMRMANDCIILDGVTCGAHFSHKRLFCPRRLYPFWREVWLRRVDPRGGKDSKTANRSDVSEEEVVH
jgi:hypothetical protein